MTLSGAVGHKQIFTVSVAITLLPFIEILYCFMCRTTLPTQTLNTSQIPTVQLKHVYKVINISHKCTSYSIFTKLRKASLYELKDN